MPTRLDTKSILQIFNESRLNADQNIQRERVNAINQALQQRQLDEAARQHDQQAAWHDEEVQRQTANDQLNATRYAEQLDREKARDLMNERHAKEQERIAMYNAETQRLGLDLKYDKNGKPISKTQFQELQMAETNKLLAEAAKRAPDVTQLQLDPGHWWNISDATQKQNSDKVNAFVKGHTDFLNFAEEAMKDKNYMHTSVAQVLAPLMAQSRVQLVALMDPNQQDLRGDESTFGGGIKFGNITNPYQFIQQADPYVGPSGGVYDSQESSQRWDVNNSIRDALKRINANPWSYPKQ
jgi:hypothetical protein